MINFRRLALVSGIAVLSAVAFTPKAQAQSQNVDFTGNIPATCTIGTVTNGALGIYDSKQLVADNAYGTYGTINITCNAGTTVKVSSIANNGTPGSVYSSLDNIYSAVQTGGATIIVGQVSPNSSTTITNPLNVPSALQSAPITNAQFRVHLIVQNFTNPLPVASYGFRVGVTFTPQ